MAASLAAGAAHADAGAASEVPASTSTEVSTEVTPLNSGGSGTLNIPCGPPPVAGHLALKWDKGIISTTVHYNNPCLKIFYIEVWVMKGGGDSIQCLIVPANTVSSKKYEHGLGHIHRVREGC